MIYTTTLISVCHPSNIEIWELASKEIAKYIKADNYLIIVPDYSYNLFSKKSDKHFKVVNESAYTSNFGEYLKYANNDKPSRYGWYLQQLIKLEAIHRLKVNERAIIWDADTIPLKNISFFTEDGNPKYYFGNEYHLPYFSNIYRLLKLDKIYTESFIAQCFPITSEWANEFFKRIEDTHKKPWYKAIIDSIDFTEESGFSEYETLGTFLSHYKSEYITKQSGSWHRFGYKLLNCNNSEEVRKKIRNKKLISNYEFISFEDWDKINRNEYSAYHKIKSKTRSLINLFTFNKNTENEKTKKTNLDTHLSNIFRNNNNLNVFQIGANDGVQNDFLRKYLVIPGNYKATLIEPIPYYVNKLKKLYNNRNDVNIIQAAAGVAHDEKSLFHIPADIAIKMNGDGPDNNWALGQGSFDREIVIYWIHKNSFRGEFYRNNINLWISSIEEIKVKTVPTRELIGNCPDKSLLIIDVQGAEETVLNGLDWNAPPTWIVIEQDTGRDEPVKILLKRGYTEIFNDGDNILFEINQY